MVHTWQTRETPHADALPLTEIQEGEWYAFHYCFPTGRRTDNTSYEETWVKAYIVSVRKDGVTLRHGDCITLSLNLFELEMEPNSDGKYACHHRLARL